MIRLENVTKKFGEKTVFEQVDQTFEQGQSVAFVGHNGCGKSTMLKVIAKLLQVTEGKVEYDRPLLIHYVPEHFRPVPMTGRKYLHYMGVMDGLDEGQISNQIERLGHDFFLDDLLDIQMKNMSKGTLQKIGVIQALLRTPDVLLLDEPLSGQDQESQNVFIEKINRLRQENMTLFMSCHEAKLLREVAQDIYTIEKGHWVPYQGVEETYYKILLENPGELPLLESMEVYGRNYKMELTGEECDRIIPELLQKGWRLRGMQDA